MKHAVFFINLMIVIGYLIILIFDFEKIYLLLAPFLALPHLAALYTIQTLKYKKIALYTNIILLLAMLALAGFAGLQNYNYASYTGDYRFNPMLLLFLTGMACSLPLANICFVRKLPC